MIRSLSSGDPRSWRGFVPGAVALAAALLVLLPLRDSLDTATAALVLVLPGVVAAMTGGRRAAIATSIAAAAAFNVGFLHPYGTFTVSLAEQVVALGVLVVVASLTATLVASEAERRMVADRRTAEAAAARAEQERLSAETAALGLAAEHRSALLRGVSHDLRTPLSTIRAVASDLRDGGGDYDPETHNELLDLVVDEAERLDRLVANLLSMSRVEAGALEPHREPVDLGELLDTCVAQHRRLLRDRQVSVEVPLTLPPVDADWTLLEQAVTNLIANAVRHTPPGSRVRLLARRVGSHVEVQVLDEGPGIPDCDRARVFEPFRRGPGSTSSGVGLAIVRAVVVAHGGEVGIDNRPAGGACVHFTLPVHGD